VVLGSPRRAQGAADDPFPRLDLDTSLLLGVPEDRLPDRRGPGVVIDHPTTIGDLRRVRQHDWLRTGAEVATCRDCGLVFVQADWLAGLPACPGPDFLLIRRTETAG
jgi:hypothetical protein